MLSDLSAKLQVILENYELNLTNNQIKEIIELFNFYKGGIIPMKVIKKRVRLQYKEIHKLMIHLVTKNILKPKYKIICENDVATAGGREYDSLLDIPPMKVCDRCSEECIILEKVSVEFEVIDNGQ